MDLNESNISIVQATCKRCYLDEIGDIEKVTIEEVATGYRRTVLASVLVEAISSGKIAVHGIAVNKDGKLYKTSRPANKRPLSPKGELIELKARIEILKETKSNATEQQSLKEYNKKLNKLLLLPKYSEADNRITTAEIERIKKKLKKCRNAIDRRF